MEAIPAALFGILLWFWLKDRPGDAPWLSESERLFLTEATARGWTFLVPDNCAAQWIELTGRSGDVAQQSDVTIGGLSLRRQVSNAG